MDDAAFDRTLGAWEDRELNAHLAEEERWDDANDKAEGIAWDSKLSELYEMAPVGVERKIEALVEDMTKHIAQLIMDNGGEI
mgnify:FL=1|tara:strand:+ start:999 stop:1244 length:246 start_codon:yes stop_codon:yes gene_type:complete